MHSKILILIRQRTVGMTTSMVYLIWIGLVHMMTVRCALAERSSRTSNGILYPRQSFIPSEKNYYLGVHQSRNRLRCIHLCQESSSCQTVMFDRFTEQCTLFSEHVEHGSGRLSAENNEHLITIRLDKDSHEMNRKAEKRPTLTTRKTREANVCENCEL